MQVRGVALNIVVLLGAVVASVQPTEARAFQQAPDGETTQQALSTTRGELLAVDVDAGILSMRADDGEVWEFRFTDDTQVEGGQSGTAGLATMAGAVVTVHYTIEGEVNVARLIEISAEG